MKTIHKLSLTAALLLGISSSGWADILVRWERVPLPIGLEINQERLIFVDKNVKVGYPPSLEGKLRIQNTGGVVYLKALAAFDSTRVQLKDIATGEIILMDLATTNKNSREAIRLVYDAQVKSNQPLPGTSSVSGADLGLSEESVASVGGGIAQQPALPVPAALTRYAAQSLYAPLRTVEPLPGVRSVATRLPSSLPTLLPGLPVKSTPLVSWQLGGYVVTAVKIQNQSAGRLTLDPRELQGRFYAATFQHNWLGGKGESSDTTTVYLVTQGAADTAIVSPAKLVKTKKKVIKTIQRTETKTVTTTPTTTGSTSQGGAK